MMEFNANGTVYRGVVPFRKPKNVTFPDAVLVVAWFDGEPDLWICDGDAGVRELRRYYTDDWGPDRHIPFQTFKLVEGS